MCCLCFDDIRTWHPGITLVLEPGPLDRTHPHYQTAHENQQHIPGMNWGSLTTLQTENITAKPGSQPTWGQRMSQQTPRCQGAGPQYGQKVNNKIEALFCKKWSIEMKPPVALLRMSWFT